MPTRLSILAGGGRIALGVVCVAASAGMVVAALTGPLPSRAAHPQAHRVTPVPAAEQRVCPGPVLALGADASHAQESRSLGAPSIVHGAVVDGGAGPATRRRGLHADASGSGGPVVVSVPAAAAARSSVAAAQGAQLHTDDIAGLAVAACDDPSADSWLVAGATTLGQTSLLVLSNPSKVDAAVTLSVWGTEGAIHSDGDTGITVKAGGQKVVPLAGLAPNAAAPVVRVRSHGGTVLATMQQSAVRGLTPLGVDLASAGAAPAEKQVIPGFPIRTLKALESAQAGDGYGTDLPAVRVLNPGDTAAQATVGVVGEHGTTAGDTFTAQLPAHTAAEVPLKGLPDGDYTVTVTGTHPLVAAARSATLGDAGEDFSWFPSAASLGKDAVVAVAPGPSPRLHVANPTTRAARVTVRQVGGFARTLTVDAGAAASLPLSGSGVYALSGTDGLVAAVGYAGDGALGGYPVTARTPLAAPIRVYTR